MSQLEQSELLELDLIILEDGYRLRRIACGTLALLMFDIFLTLKGEVAYIWRRPWSMFKTLYLICRYVPIVIPCLLVASPLKTINYCTGLEWYLLLGTTMLCIFPSDCLLALRLDKLYTSKLFRKMLIATLTCEAIAHVLLVVFNAASAEFTVIDAGTLSSFRLCISTKAPTSSRFLRLSPGIPSSIIGVLYFLFAIAAFNRHLHQKQTLTKHQFLRGSGSLAPMFIILVRDGVICYLTNFISTVAGLTLFGVYDQSILISVAPLLIAATSSIVSSRLVLILKGDPNYATGIYHTGNELRIVNSEDRDLSIL